MLQEAGKCCLHFVICTTRGQRIHHCHHHHFHPTAGHPGQCAVLHVQEGQDSMWALRKARSVRFLSLNELLNSLDQNSAQKYTL